jgi:hypothetical protein
MAKHAGLRFVPDVLHTAAGCAWNAAVMRARVGDKATAHTQCSNKPKMVRALTNSAWRIFL